jgi:RimJ/RimL family protein N-acetyltransferase
MNQPPVKLYPVEGSKGNTPTPPRLVPIHIGFSDKIHEWAGDSDNAEYFRRYAPLFAMKFDYADPHCWGVMLGHQPIGLLCLTDFDVAARKAAMGLLIEKPFRNSEVITKACVEAMRYVFEYLGYNKLYTLTLPHRTALHSRLESAGFTKEATLIANTFWRGKYWDEVQHSLLKSKYDELYLEKK